jgi:DNA-binding response OmpR family regulator
MEKQILCIEDERFISELYTRALVNAGYGVTVLSNGDDGFAAAMTGRYDIILLDIMLPGKNGVDVLKELKNSNNPIKSKIIITTNLDQQKETKEEVEALADGYLIKAEVTPKELAEYLDQLN